jgi:protein-L-isoaspartate(D-aspartate) O-methyltransferase
MTALPKSSAPDAKENFARARFHMVESQLRPNKVTDPRILTAMGKIPRELFVPSTLTGVAYLDDNIPLIAGRYLMQPMVLARLLQAAAIKAEDRVLDLAPATGYSTLVLTALSQSVTAVEPNALMHKEAEANVAKFAAGKAKILAGAPVEGCASFSPFDFILINGSVEFVPEILFNQLTEGGRLATIIRHYAPAHAVHIGEAVIYRKHGNEVTSTTLFEANVPPAPGFTAPPGFVF